MKDEFVCELLVKYVKINLYPVMWGISRILVDPSVNLKSGVTQPFLMPTGIEKNSS